MAAPSAPQPESSCASLFGAPATCLVVYLACDAFFVQACLASQRLPSACLALHGPWAFDRYVRGCCH